jgi:hypothetical protein
MKSIFSLLLLLFAVVFVDASASSAAPGGLREIDVAPHHDSMLRRQFNEKDYKAIMTNYRSDQGSLRGRKLEDYNNDDYQKSYYRSQEQHVSRGQAITLAIVVTLTVGLAAYSVFLYREYVASTVYNVLGYRLFSGSDEQMTSGAPDYEMS